MNRRCRMSSSGFYRSSGNGNWSEVVSLKYACIMVIAAALYGILAVSMLETLFPMLSPVLLYAALSFLWMAALYTGIGSPRLLKNSSGRRGIGSWMIFCPYFLLNEYLLWIHRNIGRELAFVEICPNLFLGRKLTAQEATYGIDNFDWVADLDLAAELSEVLPLRNLPGYRSLPLLDATAPTPQQMDDAINWLKQATADGAVYVHCALGHGRSACIVVAYLIATELVSTPEGGVQRLQELRCGVRLNSDQLKAVRRFQEGCKSAA